MLIIKGLFLGLLCGAPLHIILITFVGIKYDKDLPL